MTGPALLSMGEVFSAIFASGNIPQPEIIVRVIRLPVACMAVIIGVGLGTAGAQMQTILHNPLASPYTLGTSAAAAFGAAAAIIFAKNIFPFTLTYIIPIGAFVFAMLCSVVIYFISRSKSGSVQTVILAGVALSFLFNSLISLLQYFAKENEFEAIVMWMFGSLQAATWVKVIIISIVVAVCIPILLADSWKLTALKMGDDKARSMGIDTNRLRVKMIIISSLLTSVSVCFAGVIGFVGLIAPHIVRSFTGEDHRFFIPCSALMGAVILSFASVVSKIIIPGAVFPVGITTSLIGIPFLLYIILKKKNN